MRKFIVSVRLTSSKRTFVRKVLVYSMFEIEARLIAVDFCSSRYAERKEDFKYKVENIKESSLNPRFCDV